MKLQYHPGKNFGDQLNPLIFDHYLPGYFQNDNGYVLMGIGSILGFHDKYPGKKVVFSSGYDAGIPSTYGVLPEDKSSFDFICVRGPKTAALLGLEADLAITDGALLLKDIVKKNNEKKYKVSLMPHVGSEEFYDHQALCDELGWQYISPRWEVETVLEMIQQSECLVTEAMHGAIVADTLRVPWMAYQGFKTIGHFKWQDWCLSMGMHYQPFYLSPFFSDSKTEELVRLKFVKFSIPFLTSLIKPIALFKMKRRWGNNIRILQERVNSGDFQLSDQSLLEVRHQQLLERIQFFKEKYPVAKFG
jgi:succinoglycan biosynthesis protein ExoV